MKIIGLVQNSFLLSDLEYEEITVGQSQRIISFLLSSTSNARCKSVNEGMSYLCYQSFTHVLVISR